MWAKIRHHLVQFNPIKTRWSAAVAGAAMIGVPSYRAYCQLDKSHEDLQYMYANLKRQQTVQQDQLTSVLVRHNPNSIANHVKEVADQLTHETFGPLPTQSHNLRDFGRLRQASVYHHKVSQQLTASILQDPVGYLSEGIWLDGINRQAALEAGLPEPPTQHKALRSSAIVAFGIPEVVTCEPKDNPLHW